VEIIMTLNKKFSRSKIVYLCADPEEENLTFIGWKETVNED